MVDLIFCEELLLIEIPHCRPLMTVQGVEDRTLYAVQSKSAPSRPFA